MNIPRIVIAGTHSACGKSSVAAGLLRALHRQETIAQPFKVGPDFIDPSLLTAAAGRSCRNLDSWMLPHATVLELFARGADGAQVAVIEGMMGLYDGHGGSGDAGSTAEVARLLGAPVVLVIDVGGSARSAAATALGFSAFDPHLTIAGVIATRAGGARHVATLREALDSSGIPLLGVLPWDDRLRMPERHLGLIPAAEESPEDVIEALGDVVAAHVDVARLLHIARTASPVVLSGPPVFPPMPAAAAVRIGVARDEAFTFYYQDSLEMLEANGAILVPFSPAHDHSLPAVEGVYLGGGFPEVHGEALAENAIMRRAVAGAVRSGMPVYAECGGMLYLTARLVDQHGVAHEMAGVLPAVARVHDRLAVLNYVTLEAQADTLLLRRGESVRGHEYHFSTVEPVGTLEYAYRSHDGHGIAAGRDGITMSGLLATYTHVHFAADPVMAWRFVDACKHYKAARQDRG